MRPFLLAVLCLLCALPAEARSRKKPRADEGSCPAKCNAQPLFRDAKAPAPVDAEVLKLCDAQPGRVDPADVRDFFRKHLSDPRLAETVQKVAPWTRRGGDQADWLASIWSGPARRNAFTHVLCGDDLDTAKLGGLHLEARYRELERQGKLCYQGPASGGPRHDGQPCDGKQCLLRYRGVQGYSCGVKDMGGFAQGLDSIDLLAAGTRAYVACCMGGAPSETTGRLRDGGRYAGPKGLTFQIWCGERNGRPGIATFYPAAGRPNCGP